MSQKCDHFHVFVGVILRYPGENAVLLDKGRTELKKQKRFQCHAKLFEKPAVLAAPCVVANYLGNGDFFMINDNDDLLRSNDLVSELLGESQLVGEILVADQEQGGYTD